MNLKEKRNTLINIVFYAVITALGIIGFKYLLPLLFPFFAGFLIAMFLKPLVNMLKRKLRISEKILSAVVTALFFLLLLLLACFLGERIIKEGSDIIKKLPYIYSEIISPLFQKILNSLSQNLEPFLNKDDFFAYFDSITQSFSGKVTDFTADFVTLLIRSLPSFVISVVFAVISAFFFSLDYYKITSFLAKLIPIKHRDKLFESKQICGKTLKNMIKGYSIILIITFMELFIGLSLFRVQNALVLSLLISFLDILPVIGSGTFLIPFAIVSLMYGRISLGIGVLILYLIITVARNIIEPKIIGKRIGLPPIVMLITVYAGAKLFGFLGVLFLPIIITVLKEVFYNHFKVTMVTPSSPSPNTPKR